jgi:hypothetical protein
VVRGIANSLDKAIATTKAEADRFASGVASQRVLRRGQGAAQVAPEVADQVAEPARRSGAAVHARQHFRSVRDP